MPKVFHRNMLYIQQQYKWKDELELVNSGKAPVP